MKSGNLRRWEKYKCSVVQLGNRMPWDDWLKQDQDASHGVTGKVILIQSYWESDWCK